MADSKNSEILINDKAIKTEMSKLRRIFKKHYTERNDKGKEVNTDRGNMLERLIYEAAFTRCVLMEAQRLIKEQGLETITINASQKFQKAVPAVGIYSDYLRTYTKVIDMLISYIPDKAVKKESKLLALMLND
jgi:hypothetical protein